MAKQRKRAKPTAKSKQRADAAAGESYLDYIAEAISANLDDRPDFKPNTVISEPSLVVDELGKAWWVNPALQSIQPA